MTWFELLTFEEENNGNIILIAFVYVYVCVLVCMCVQTFEVNSRAIGLLNCSWVSFVYSCFIFLCSSWGLLLGNHHSKNTIYLTLHMMASTDSVRGACEEHWHGTKQPAIYVWNINKIFCVLSTRKVDLFKVIVLICCIFWWVMDSLPCVASECLPLEKTIRFNSILFILSF